jgi:hypothetical protein
MLEMKDFPVNFQDFENEAQEYSFMISDNKIAELAEHDDSMILDEIKNFKLEDFELLGMNDFSFVTQLANEEFEEKQKIEQEKKYILEVQFPSEMDMMDVHDDLLNKGYIVRKIK